MRRALMLLLAMATTACATAGAPLPETPFMRQGLAETVKFDHGCPRDRTLFIREGPWTVDLDVCGAVRRYKGVGGSWVDVTSLYPASSLPPPRALPEQQPRKEAPRGPDQAENPGWQLLQ
jgi:hypothetical protein